MGKYMRKCGGIAEVAAVEMARVGVRTRARALAMAISAAANRRKIGGGVSKHSPSLVQLRIRRRPIATPLNSGTQTSSDDHRSSGPRSDHVTTSCCSSNASSEVVTESFKIVDPEGEIVRIETHCRERRENTPSSEMEAESGELESTATLSKANSRSKATAKKWTVKIPSEAEIEEFFAAAESEVERRFREKYNFDLVNFVPLEGRYEWVRVGREEEN
ncbi:cyclin-dependent kinase inhibitor 1-like [Rhododendron vialii]|uniref:cyclin-dependent kinase inhibitor 1-like n=1 Tax=Rhododendron vialii TaxID=182163 RepID=UPI0026604C0A|nr:cyclin-dependent kinase inhibitor 1-like [Rhododendron vialii]